MYLKLRILYLFVFVSTISGYTQETDFNWLPPVHVLVDSAISNSARLDFQRNDQKQKETAIRSTRRDWGNYVYVEGSYGYGVFDQLLLSENPASVQATQLISNSEQQRYFAGLSVKLPLSAILNKGLDMKISRLELEKASSSYEMAKEIITREILVLTNDLKNAYKILLVRQNILQDLELAMTKADNEFKKNQINMADWTVVKSGHAKASVDYLDALNNFNKKLDELMLLTGIDFKTTLP